MRPRRYEDRAYIGSDAVAFSTTLVARERAGGEGWIGVSREEAGRGRGVPRRLAAAMSCKIFN